MESLTIIRIATLGQGRFGTIGCLYDTEKKSIIAVKQKLAYTNSKEVEILDKINADNLEIQCPYICEMLSYDIIGDYLYLYMKPYLGGPLHRHIKSAQGGKLHLDIARSYIAQTICGLWFLEYHHCIHRDLKANNIILDEKGRLKICDFGFSKCVSGQNIKLYSLVGTKHVMSPEMICEDLGYDYSTDWWALGILLFEMIYGHPPDWITSNDDENNEKHIAYKAIEYCTDDNKSLISEFDEIANRWDISKRLEIDIGLSHVNNIISKILVINPNNRLGCRSDMDLIFAHPFFQGLSWDSKRVDNDEDISFDHRLGFMDLLEQYDINGYSLSKGETNLTDDEQLLFADF